MDYSKDDQFLSSIGEDGTLRVWNIKESKCLTAKPYFEKGESCRYSSSWERSGNLAIPYNDHIEFIQVCVHFHL